MFVARRAVVDYYAQPSSSVGIDDILLTTSTSEAYSFVFRLLCNPCDEILIPEPSYPLFAFLAEIQDVKLVPYPCSTTTAGKSISTPASRNHAENPRRHRGPSQQSHGTLHRARGNRRAESRCAPARELAIIADEVFLDFALKPSAPQSFAATRDALTFTMSGVSKICGLPQMKLAWLVTSGPQERKAPALERLEVIADTYLSMNAPVQYALRHIARSAHRDFNPKSCPRPKNLAANWIAQLAQQKSCARLEVRPAGTRFCASPRPARTKIWRLLLLESQGVYTHPGHFYDFPADGFLVVSLITPEEDFAKGIEQLLAMFAIKIEMRRRRPSV